MGRYSVVLGLTTALPTELFLGGEARWLDVAVEGLAPQPRRLLVSVPYTLKAADADSVGGRPLSAFVLAGDKTGVGADGLTYVDTRVLSSGLSGQPPGGAGTANFIGMFTDTTTLGNSVIYQTPGGAVGVNTLSPAASFHSVSTLAPRRVLRRLQQRAGSTAGRLPRRRAARQPPRPRCRPTTSWADWPCARVRGNGLVDRTRPGDVQVGRELDGLGERDVSAVHDDTARQYGLAGTDACHTGGQRRHRDAHPRIEAERRGHDREHDGRLQVPGRHESNDGRG